MNLEPKTVFVLGAGLTKAFVPDAPLMVDHYDVEGLKRKFSGLKHAMRILELELDKNSDGKINIERLMTRLHSGMPYDFKNTANEEMPLLLSRIMRLFIKRIEEAKKGKRFIDELATFASHCVNNQITCITFNYDDILDQALWEVKKVRYMGKPPYWHPDGGYGFFCRPSVKCIRDANAFMDKDSSLLLKLHGSINWYPRLGDPQPYAVDAILHHAEWIKSTNLADITETDRNAIKLHLEPDPFFVPPVLVKSDLSEQPILRLIWTRAYEELENAEKVVFLGYSFPETDMAARFLFSEAIQIQKGCQIEVVNKKEATEAVKNAYGKVFSGSKINYRFDGVLEWSRGLS